MITLKSYYEAGIIYSTRIYKQIINVNIIYIFILLYILLSIIIINYQFQINKYQSHQFNNHQIIISSLQKHVSILNSVVLKHQDFTRRHTYEIHVLQQKMTNQNHVNETFAHVTNAVIDMTRYNGKRIVHEDVDVIPREVR